MLLCGNFPSPPSKQGNSTGRADDEGVGQDTGQTHQIDVFFFITLFFNTSCLLNEWKWIMSIIKSVSNKNSCQFCEPGFARSAPENSASFLDAGRWVGRDNRGRDGWIASPTQWTWVWARSGRWWRTGRPGVLQSVGLQRVRYDWTTVQHPLGSWRISDFLPNECQSEPQSLVREQTWCDAAEPWEQIVWDQPSHSLLTGAPSRTLGFWTGVDPWLSSYWSLSKAASGGWQAAVSLPLQGRRVRRPENKREERTNPARKHTEPWRCPISLHVFPRCHLPLLWVSFILYFFFFLFFCIAHVSLTALRSSLWTRWGLQE